MESWIEQNTTLFVFLVIWGSIVALLLLLALSRFLYRCVSGSIQDFKGQHVLITGGSEGLGKEMAKELVQNGANVTIVARTEAKLRNALDSITNNSPTHGEISYLVGDVTDEAGMQSVVERAIENYGPVDVLIPCAGSSLTGKLYDRGLDDYRRTMELNYFGVLNTIYPVISKMMDRRKGQICFVSSAAAMTSYVGYVSYAPTKYAVRGLADSLRNELLPYNIKVHIAYPANMDTRGYEVEQLTKPAEGKAIEASDPLYKPEKLAKSILKSLSRGDYNIYCGAIEVSLLGMVASGMSPRNNTALDMLFMPLAAIIGVIVRFMWDSEVTKSKYANSSKSPASV